MYTTSTGPNQYASPFGCSYRENAGLRWAFAGYFGFGGQLTNQATFWRSVCVVPPDNLDPTWDIGLTNYIASASVRIDLYQKSTNDYDVANYDERSDCLAEVLKPTSGCASGMVLGEPFVYYSLHIYPFGGTTCVQTSNRRP